MLPIKLTFDGLRSYTSETTIDFADLEFFAVIGDTGAGKSTIIEAMSFALYARSTFSGKGQSELIADSASVVSVSFTFKVGAKTWTVTRARRRTTTPGVDKLECDDGTTPAVNNARAVSARIEEILGLSHEQFCRAVVMPQGAFDELLKANATERSKILRSILGLDEIAATGQRARDIAVELEPLRATYTERRAKYPNDPASALDAARHSLTEAETVLGCCTDALDTIDGPAHERERINAASVPLRIAIDAVPDAADAHDTLARCRSLGETLKGQLAIHAKAEAAAADDRTRLEGERAATLAGFESSSQLAGAAARVAGVADRLASDLTALTDAEQGRADLGDPPTDRPDPAVVAAAGAAAEAVNDADTAYRAAVQAEQGARRAYDTLTEAYRDAAKAERILAEARTAVADATARAETLDRERGVVHSRRDEVVAERNEAAAANQVVAVAAGHQPGDPCPVCEQALPATFTVHDGADIDALNEKVASAEKELAEADKAYAEARGAVAAAEGRRDDARDRYDTCTGKVESSASEAAAAGADPDADTVDAAIAALSAHVETLDAERNVAAAARDAAEDALQVARTQVEVAKAEYGAAVRAADDQVIAAQKTIDGHRAILDRLPGMWRPDGEPDAAAVTDLRTRLDDAVATVERIDEALVAADTARGNAKAASDSIQERAREEVTGPATAAVHAVNNRLGRVRDVVNAASALADLIGATGPGSDGLDIIAADVKVDQLDVTIDAVDSATAAAAAVVDAAVAIHTDAQDAIRAHTETVDRALDAAGYPTVEALHTAAGEARSNVTVAEKAVANANTEMTEARAVDSVLAELIPFHDNVQVLASTLTDAKFIGYLLEHRQAELLHEASQRLRDITNNKFGFTRDFSVLAIASGATRTPENLSGGQKFQASLALALALVEIATRGGGKLDSVFVDEGFGSLDVSSLDTALSTLEKVAGGGKVVGLISHLRPVAEHVETVLHVTYDDVNGSSISVLDPEQREQLLADDIRSGLHE